MDSNPAAGSSSAQPPAENGRASQQASASSLPDPSLPAPSLPADEVGFTAADLIAHQARLEAQASEAIPFKFDTCTHSMGYIRQPVYACRTCGGGGVCAGCSVSCHAEHDLVELFNKREFRCDCGTPNLYREKTPNKSKGKVKVEGQLEYPPNAPPCSLRKPGYDPQNERNRYNHNFEGGFCYCVRGKTYDPEKEDETMFQCLVCEEWLHESCTSLRQTSAGSDSTDRKGTKGETSPDDSEPPLIDHELFDLMICDACVRKPGNELLRQYAGSKGWYILVPTETVRDVTACDGIRKIQVPTEQNVKQPLPKDGEGTEDAEAVPAQSWQIFGLPLEPAGAESEPKGREDEPTSQPDPAAGPQEAATVKRAVPTDDDASEPNAKRIKTDVEQVSSDAIVDTGGVANSTGCRAPQGLDLVQALPQSNADPYIPAMSAEAAELQRPAHRYDIFLSEDFRDRICRCDSCLAKWKSLSFVLEAEETYSPPSDPDASVRDDDAASITSSTYDLGMAALRSMPREKMINSLQAYSKFRDALWEHLRPFAGSGKMVREEDVRAFFNKKLLNKDA